jgi:hypothetical protein
MNIEGTDFYTCKECHKTESLRNHTATAHREREQLGDRRNVGENSCNCGDGTGQMAQPMMFMMMMMMISKPIPVSNKQCFSIITIKHFKHRKRSLITVEPHKVYIFFLLLPKLAIREYITLSL